METEKREPLTYQGRELDLSPTNCATADVVETLRAHDVIINVVLEPGDATHYELLLFRMGRYSTPERGGYRSGSIGVIPVSSLTGRKNLFVIDPEWGGCSPHDFEDLLNAHTREVYSAFLNEILEAL